MTLVITVLALYRHDRTWGIAGLFALWFLAPLLRRLFGLMTGYVDQDPLSRGAVRGHDGDGRPRAPAPPAPRPRPEDPARGRPRAWRSACPSGSSTARRRRSTPSSPTSPASRARCWASREPGSVERSALRKVLLFGLPPDRRLRLLPALASPARRGTGRGCEATQLTSIGDPEQGKIRAFGTLNSPGALGAAAGPVAAVLPHRPPGAADRHRRRRPHRRRAVADLRALGLGGPDRGRARARRRLARPERAGRLRQRGHRLRDARWRCRRSATRPATSSTASARSTRAATPPSEERSATVSETLPIALAAPLGHGIGSAGEASKLNAGLEPARPRQRLPQPALPGRASSASRS